MVLKNFIKKLQDNKMANRLAQQLTTTSGNSKSECADYESAVRALNEVQSNIQYIQAAQKQNLSHTEQYLRTIKSVEECLIRSDICLESLDKLSVIHITGTKGKGSTSAICESILRHHGLKTGFFSSPHLVEVRERIRINGNPLQKREFSKHFWHLHNKLQKSNPNDMPMYFKFLTILAFRVFLVEKVDVAVVEVGIGGEYDCTNVLRRVPVVGITSIGIDHLPMLGKSVEDIAWHKAGIMKPDCKAFTVPQAPAVMKILQQRSVERNCTLEVIEPFPNIPVDYNRGPTEIFNLNASLAVALAQAWLKDGAHTQESIKICAEWFVSNTTESRHKKALIFNATGNRDYKQLMSALIPCNFEKVYFVPNKATENDAHDRHNVKFGYEQQLTGCYSKYQDWLELQDENDKYPRAKSIKVLPSVFHVLHECALEQHDILVTGSLHLVGATLSLIDPDLNN